jgi:transcriptional regulator with XRE-family HTH domain
MLAFVGNSFYRAVAQRVADVRRQTGMTQVEGARRANLNRSLLARIEAGAENLSLQTLSRLALAYGVLPEVFLEGLEADPAALEETDRVNRREPERSGRRGRTEA